MDIYFSLIVVLGLMVFGFICFMGGVNCAEQRQKRDIEREINDQLAPLDDPSTMFRRHDDG